MTNDYSLPPDVLYREKTCGRYSAALADTLSDAVRTAVAFCGPASFREPEIDNCWHPYLIRRGFLFFLFDQVVPFARAFVGGVRRFFLGHFGACIFIPNASALVLGITPLSICTLTADGVQTHYCHPDDVKKMAWIVFDEAGKEKNGYSVTRFVILKVYIRILWCWFTVSIFGLRKKDWAVASVITLRWIISLQWVTLWMFSKKVSFVLASTKQKKIFCVHEMWPWARMMWSVAHRFGIPTIAIQHASVTRTKLWYFPTQEELASGFATPETVVVFSDKERGLLSPFFPARTSFFFTCGPRYAHWKSRVGDENVHITADAPILFAGSIPWWDNAVILRAVQTLLRQPHEKRPIIVRFHPLAVIPRKWRVWVSSQIEEKKLSISHTSLHDDILESAAVVGMNTTVLAEAVAMGRAAVILSDNQYLSFATDLGVQNESEKLHWENIENAIQKMQSDRQAQMRRGRKTLGIDQPVFRMT